MGKVQPEIKNDFYQVNQKLITNLLDDLKLGSASRVNQILLFKTADTQNIEEISINSTKLLQDMDTLIRDFTDNQMKLKILCEHGFIKNSMHVFLIFQARQCLYDFAEKIDGYIIDQDNKEIIRGSVNAERVKGLIDSNTEQLLLAFQNLIQQILSYNEVNFANGVK